MCALALKVSLTTEDLKETRHFCPVKLALKLRISTATQEKNHFVPSNFIADKLNTQGTLGLKKLKRCLS